MLYQLMASGLMVITLYIYHGYEVNNLTRDIIDQVMENKNIAIVLLYMSRFLSGCSAGECVSFFC